MDNLAHSGVKNSVCAPAPHIFVCLDSRNNNIFANATDHYDMTLCK